MSEMNGELQATEQSWADTMSDQWTEQAEHAVADDGRVEFGGFGAVAVGASFWSKLKSVFKAAAKGAAKSGLVKDALNSYSPGLGDAAQKGMALVEAAKTGDPAAVAQIKDVAEKAKTDPTYGGAYQLLSSITAARNEAVAETAAVGWGAFSAKDPVTGKKHTFPTKAKAKAWLKKRRQQQQQQQQQGGAQQRGGRRSATTQDVARGMQQLPPQGRQQLAGMVQRAQQQGRAPLALPGQPAYGTPAYWAWQQQMQGQPYGMQQGQPYGYGVPYGMQQPYGGMYYDEGYLEQSGYYGGDPDEELAAAFADDAVFPDESLVGENAIQYGG